MPPGEKKSGASSSREQPVFLLLTNYVLDRIGALRPEDAESMARIVARVFGAGADWRAELREQLGLTSELDGQLVSMWGHAQKIGEQNHTVVDPREFARMVVEENFSDLVTMIDGPPGAQT